MIIEFGCASQRLFAGCMKAKNLNWVAYYLVATNVVITAAVVVVARLTMQAARSPADLSARLPRDAASEQ